MSQKSSLPQAAKSVSQVLMSDMQVLERSNCIGTYGEDVWMLNAAQSMSQRGVWDIDQCPASDKAAGHEDGNNA